MKWETQDEFHLHLDIKTRQPTCSSPEFLRQRKKKMGFSALLTAWTPRTPRTTGLPVRIIINNQ